MTITRLAVALLLLILALRSASAHHLWLEPEGQGVRLYFGEFGENLRELSPGALDRLQPGAKSVSATGERPLKVEKSPNGFFVAGEIGGSDSVVAEDARYPVFVRTKDGTTTRSIYWPAARLVRDRALRTPTLALDIVPTGGERFQVTFKGKPLAKAKVEVLTAAGWSRELHSDEDGQIAVSLPWRGPYVLEVQHADSTPGKRGEEAYDTISYVTSLTVVQPQGLEPLPPLPPARPY